MTRDDRFHAALGEDLDRLLRAARETIVPELVAGAVRAKVVSVAEPEPRTQPRAGRG